MAVTVGSTFPDFVLLDESGTQRNVSKILEKNGLVLFLYPKANTPGCTKQAKAFNEAYERLEKAGFVVLGLSKDKPTAQASWKDKLQLRFPLLTDDGTVISELGCSSGASTIRSVFVVKKKGTVLVAKRKVTPAESVELALEAAGIDDEEKPAAAALLKVHEPDSASITTADNSTAGKRSRGVKRAASSAPKAKSRAKAVAKRAPSQRAASGTDTASPAEEKASVKAESPKKPRNARARSTTPRTAAPKRAASRATEKKAPQQAPPRASRRTRATAASASDEQPMRGGRRAAAQH